MAEYIGRQALRNAHIYLNEEGVAVIEIEDIPAAEVVSKAAYDQVAWERHLAEVQLKSIGKSIGEKMDDVQPVVRCKDCKHFHLDYFGEVNGASIIVAHEICDLWAGGCRTTQDTFCSNGVRKDGET